MPTKDRAGGAKKELSPSGRLALQRGPIITGEIILWLGENSVINIGRRHDRFRQRTRMEKSWKQLAKQPFFAVSRPPI
jgi:hypothetical protein